MPPSVTANRSTDVPDARERPADGFAVARRRRRRRVPTGRHAPAEEDGHEAVENGQDQPREQRGGEQLGDRLLGDDGVDHQDERRRDQDAEGAAGGDRAGRERRPVAGREHLRD